jgi:hypothetical protein
MDGDDDPFPPPRRAHSIARFVDVVGHGAITSWNRSAAGFRGLRPFSRLVAVASRGELPVSDGHRGDMMRAAAVRFP